MLSKWEILCATVNAASPLTLMIEIEETPCAVAMAAIELCIGVTYESLKDY